MAERGYAIEPSDPRAPSQAQWDAMDPLERQAVVDALPSEIVSATPPEGDLHRLSKTRALETLEEHFRRIRRRIYLSAELPVYYPGEPMFAPDLLAVRDVEAHDRSSWIVSHEQRGLDLVLEIHVLGDARKDYLKNVDRYARLKIPEYFAFNPVRRRLDGWRLSGDVYAPIIPQEGRWRSDVLELDLAVFEGRLRFLSGSSVLLDSRELIGQLSRMVDDAVRRAEDEARRAEDEARRAEDEARRAEDEARRAEDEARRAEDEARRADRLAERLRQLGIDPDTE